MIVIVTVITAVKTYRFRPGFSACLGRNVLASRAFERNTSVIFMLSRERSLDGDLSAVAVLKRTLRTERLACLCVTEATAFHLRCPVSFTGIRQFSDTCFGVAPHPLK